MPRVPRHLALPAGLLAVLVAAALAAGTTGATAVAAKRSEGDRRRLEVERVVESDAKRQREVERMDRTVNGTALEAACWGVDAQGRKSCLSYDEALAADAAFPPSEVGSFAFVVAWCGDGFDWVADLMARSPGAQQVWKRLIVYQKCAIYHNASDGGFIVAYRHDGYAATKPQRLDCDVTGPNTTLAPTDVRRAILNHSCAAANSSVNRALRALDIRVVPLIEPGRGYPTGLHQMRPPYSTDEVGAYFAPHLAVLRRPRGRHVLRARPRPRRLRRSCEDDGLDCVERRRAADVLRHDAGYRHARPVATRHAGGARRAGQGRDAQAAGRQLPERRVLRVAAVHTAPAAVVVRPGLRYRRPGRALRRRLQQDTSAKTARAARAVEQALVYVSVSP